MRLKFDGDRKCRHDYYVINSAIPNTYIIFIQIHLVRSKYNLQFLQKFSIEHFNRRRSIVSLTMHVLTFLLRIVFSR